MKKLSKKQENILDMIFKEIAQRRVINIFDIGKVYNAGRNAFVLGEDPVLAMKEAFNQYECDRSTLMTLESI